MAALDNQDANIQLRTRANQEQAACIYVGNIPSKVRDWMPVRDFFAKFGGVKFVKLLTSKTYGNNNKFAFVTFYQQWAMEKALKATPEELRFEGRILRVDREDKNRSQKKKVPLTADDIGKIIRGNMMFNNNNRKRKKKWTPCEDEITGTCYIDMLNADCMMCIIGYLTVQQRINIERVCKKWQLLSMDSWSDVKSLCITNLVDDCMVSTHLFLWALRRAGSALTTLDLSEIFSTKQDVVHDICRIIKNIPSPSSLTTLIISEQVNKILTPKLVNTLVHNTPQLKVLDLNSTAVNDEELLQVLNNMNSIEELNLNSTDIQGRCFDHFHTLRKLSVKGLQEEFLPALYENIEKMNGHLQELAILAPATGPNNRLKITCHSLTKLSMDADMALEVKECVYLDFAGFPNLVDLEVTDSHYFMRNPANMKNLAKNCLKLTKLVIAGPTSTSSYYEHDGDVDKQRHLYQPAIKELVKMSSVKYLDISYLPYHYKDGVDEVTKMKGLEQLHIMGMMGDFTQQDLADIVSELPALRMLNASEAVRGDPKIEIKSFIEQLSCEGDRPDLEIILGGRKFELTGVIRWKLGRFIINEQVTSEYKDDAAQVFDYGDPYDPISMLRMRMAMFDPDMDDYGLFDDDTFGIDDDYDDDSYDDDDDDFMHYMMMRS